MVNTAAWILFFLGLGHLGFGLVKFRAPVLIAGGVGMLPLV